MKISLKEIHGPWDEGWVLDKHMLKSTFLGHNEQGHPQFENIRTDIGEATFQLKYRNRWEQAPLLAAAIASAICPKFDKIGFVVPMPASNARPRQPVDEVAQVLGKILDVPVFPSLLHKAPGGKSLKDLNSKDEKLSVLAGAITLNEMISNEGKWNALLIDDLYDSGASMEVATQALRKYKKVGRVYVAALTWK